MSLLQLVTSLDTHLRYRFWNLYYFGVNHFQRINTKKYLLFFLSNLQIVNHFDFRLRDYITFISVFWLESSYSTSTYLMNNEYVRKYLVNLSNRTFSFVNVFYRVSPNNTKLVFLDTYVDCIITCKWDKSLIQTRNTTELSLSQPKVYFPISTIRQSKAGFERQMSSFFFASGS